MSSKKSEVSSDGWTVTTNRYVAYIDIMGFKDMVARTDHFEIYEMMKRIDEYKKDNENTKWSDVSSKLVKTTTYSDSIMIYSKDDSYDALDFFISVVSGLIDDLFIEKIPHKGAIAFGLMTFDEKNSIFFGQPLIDAYLLQDELLFYGIIIHASAQEQIEKTCDYNDLLFVENYLCPLKLGASNHLTVQPLHTSITDPKHKIYHENLLESIKELRFKTSGHLRRYIDNTEAYISYIKAEDAKRT